MPPKTKLQKLDDQICAALKEVDSIEVLANSAEVDHEMLVGSM